MIGGLRVKHDAHVFLSENEIVLIFSNEDIFSNQVVVGSN